MDIKKIATYSTQAVPKPKGVKGRNESSDRGISGTVASNDQVSLSKGYLEMANIHKGEDVRMDRVNELRNLIQNDAFEIEPDKIAEKMLQEAW